MDTFQRQGGLKPDRLEVGLKMDATFFPALVQGFLAGDIVNLLAWRVRPYEKVPGSADAVLHERKKIVSDALRNRKSALFALRRAGRRMAQGAGRG